MLILQAVVKTLILIIFIEILYKKNLIPEEKNPTMMQYPRVIFFDDNPYNIRETLVNYEFNCWPFPINPQKGIPNNR